MISMQSLCILLFFVWNVQKFQAVKLFGNIVPVETSMYTVFKPVVISKTCYLKPERGPCRSNISMWYFDSGSSNCSTFEWGGCQGNGNRFDTFPECWGFCMSKQTSRKRRPRYCSLTFDYGFCFGAVERFYYDAAWKVCKSTIYSGCGGNKNNFYSLEQCEQICRFGKAVITTVADTRGAAGHTRKVLIINPWNTTPKTGLDQAPEVKRNSSG